jgi:hypothetical protein
LPSGIERRRQCVTVRDIEIWRDGGTITFTLDASELADSYRLRTPLAGVPRPVIRDERELESSAEDERHLLAELQNWLAAQTTPTVEARLAELDVSPSGTICPSNFRRRHRCIT